MPRAIRTFIRVAAPAAAFALFGAGCITLTSGSRAADGGLYRSADRGEKWLQLSALPTPKGVGSIASADVTAIAFDPGDPRAIYLGTAANGLFYSYDGGAGFDQAAGITSGKIAAVGVSPRDKCTIFVATGNRIVRSEDCNRSYAAVYTDTREGVVITSLIIDWYNPRQVYAATSRGELVRSGDEGNSWALLKRFEDGIQKVVMSTRDSRTLLVALKSNGLFRTADAGETWTEIRKQLNDFPSAKTFFDLAEVRTEEATYILASKNGLLRTADNGDTWTRIETLTPPGGTVIYALAINPKNGREIYYATANTLYRSLDGGATWTPRKLPTSRAGTALAVDPNDGNVIYLGGTTIKK